MRVLPEKARFGDVMLNVFLTMARGICRSAFYKVTEEQNCVEGSEHCTKMREEARRLLDTGGDDYKAHVVDSFSDELVSAINTCLDFSGCRSAAARREKAQSSFHKLRLSKLPAMWGKFYTKMGIEIGDPLLLQSVSQQVFDTLLLNSMSTNFPSGRPEVRLEELSRDEENALRYACGYVPFKLLRKYQKQSHDKAVKFVTCLRNMAVEDQEEGSFEDYTMQWLQKVNRGGLFCVSTQCYDFFRAIEYQVRTRLPHLLASQTGTKQELIDAVVEDQDVEFFWSILSAVIDDEADACQLLQEIVELWVTIRGFSTTSSWLEQYKRAKQKTTRKAKGLRKGLAQKSTQKL